MLRQLFSKKIPEESKTEEKNYPYQRIIAQLEELSEKDVVLVEAYLQNLKNRRLMPKKTPKQNQRTKGAELKAKQKAPKQKRKLGDEIQEARQKMINDKVAANERR